MNILTHESKENHEYDRERVLKVYHAIYPFIEEDSYYGGYTEYPKMTDDDRIINLFELLKDSLLGDMIFSAYDWDSSSELSERLEEE